MEETTKKTWHNSAMVLCIILVLFMGYVTFNMYSKQNQSDLENKNLVSKVDSINKKYEEDKKIYLRRDSILSVVLDSLTNKTILLEAKTIKEKQKLQILIDKDTTDLLSILPKPE